MKSKMKWLFSIVVIAMLCFSQPVLAQDPPDPPDPGGGGGPAAGAPIGGGAGILISLVIAYGAERWYKHRKKNLQE